MKGKDMGREYRPADSVRRINAALSATGLDESRGVRHAGNLLGSSVGMKRATVMHTGFEIDGALRGDENLWTSVLQCFAYETSEAVRSVPCLSGVVFSENFVRAVFGTVLKLDVDGVLHAAACVSSIADAVSVKLKRERLYTGDCPLKIQTGIFYGSVSMVPVSSGEDGVPKYMWVGDAVDKAAGLSEMSDGDIVVDGCAWAFLNADNRRLFRMCDRDGSPVFRGVVKNMAMNNCILRTRI